jgi:hypothetical protein
MGGVLADTHGKLAQLFTGTLISKGVSEEGAQKLLNNHVVVERLISGLLTGDVELDQTRMLVIHETGRIDLSPPRT